MKSKRIVAVFTVLVPKVCANSVSHTKLPMGRAVVVRIRPNSTDSGSHTGESCVSLSGQMLRLQRSQYDYKEFEFDHVLGPEDNQESAFDVVGLPIVSDLLVGLSSTVVAYGQVLCPLEMEEADMLTCVYQTGTGKTHTMFGDLKAWDATPHHVVSAQTAHLDQRFACCSKNQLG